MSIFLCLAFFVATKDSGSKGNFEIILKAISYEVPQLFNLDITLQHICNP